jgi:hypothetical protein
MTAERYAPKKFGLPKVDGILLPNAIKTFILSGKKICKKPVKIAGIEPKIITSDVFTSSKSECIIKKRKIKQVMDISIAGRQTLLKSLKINETTNQNISIAG